MENIIKIIEKSKTLSDAIKEIGWPINGTSYHRIYKIINENKIDTSHLLKRKDILKSNGFKRKYQLKDILISGSTYNNRASLKRRLVSEGLMEYKCVSCGNTGEWMGKKISLILDHINGVNNDNRIENLRFLCPNCNATLDTHCGKNIKKKNQKEKNIKRLESMKKRRLVKRPPYEQLINEIDESGYAGTGRKYGVSDNAIRKWVKFYEKNKKGS